VTEHELQSGVIDAARILGWRVAHFRPALTRHGWRTPVQGDGAGFPDLVLVRDRVLWVELKVGRNRLSPDQQAWFEALHRAGQAAHVWTDHDWSAGGVEAELLKRSPA